MKQLKIAADLSLPIDAATQTFAFIARKGAGKTYAAGKLVELLMTAGVQVVILDTVGNWYGLRLSADGKSAGFDVPVLGGLRGDIPLDAAGGALIADVVVETGRSLVIDMSQFSLADRKRFAAAFGQRLWQAKKADRHPSPLHLVIEESQLIVPQDVRGDSAAMVGIFEEIIRLGRNYGIGVSMITQRPQSVNKEVLNMTECLFVGQVNGSQERDALKKWISHQGMDPHLVDELPSLKIGTFFVWSPQWLDVLMRVEILPKTTYDASATPKVGDKRVQRDLKPLDLSELQTRLAATIERQKADDPRELRKQLAEANRMLANQAKAMGDLQARKPAEKQKVVEKPVLTDAQIAALDKQLGRLEAAIAKAADVLTKPFASVREQLGALTVAVKSVRQPALPMPPMPAAVAAWGRQFEAGARVEPRRQPAPAANGNGDGALSRAARAILVAAAQLHPGYASRARLSVLSGYSINSSSFANALGALRSSGFIDGSGDTNRITDAGRHAVGDVPQLPNGGALVAYWAGRLGKAERALLEVFAAHAGAPVSKAQLSAESGYSETSSSFANALGQLRTLELVRGLQLNHEVFES